MVECPLYEVKRSTLHIHPWPSAPIEKVLEDRPGARLIKVP